MKVLQFLIVLTLLTGLANAQVPDSLLKAAKQGDASAQDNLGKIYLHGTGVLLDYKGWWPVRSAAGF